MSSPELQQAEEWEERAKLLKELGRFEEAIAAQEKANAVRINAVKLDAKFWFEHGNQLYFVGDFEGALASLDLAIKLKPGFHQAWFNQGIALFSLNRFEDAATSFHYALGIKPDDYKTAYYQGRALFNLNRFEDAVASYDHALAIQPDRHEAWGDRGIALFNLNRFDDAITNYATGLKHVPQEPPIGQGLLHQGKGNIYFYQAQRSQNIQAARSYYLKALRSYQTAMPSLEDYPEFRLELIQNCIKTYLALNHITSANQWRTKGLEIFRKLLNQQSTTQQKRLLEVKFSGFSQIATDALVSDTQITIALETADRYKNRCLTWILDDWKETVTSPSYAEMRQLVSGSTAIVYWHLSEDALTTFILTPNSEDPILLDRDRASLMQRQQKLDQWMKHWDKHYNDYRSKGKEQSESKANHPWRRNLKANLDELREILGIAAINPYLSNITNLILVPHRDLHRFPLHALFPENYTISYLPSLQIGLNLQQKANPQTKFLLSVEDPARDDIEPMKFAQLESAILRSLFSPNVESISPNESDRATVETALKQHQGIFHFTGHGRYDPRQPENSELGLKDTDNLTAKEISQTRELANYHLVSLSACETGISGIQTIQTEYVGLASAFLTAGVSNVISTLWTVEEISNAYLMVRFYQFWLDGNSFARSLKLAQNWLRTVTNAKLAEWIEQLLEELELDGDIRSRLESQIRRIQKDSSTSGGDSEAKSVAECRM